MIFKLKSNKTGEIKEISIEDRKTLIKNLVTNFDFEEFKSYVSYNINIDGVCLHCYHFSANIDGEDTYLRSFFCFYEKDFKAKGLSGKHAGRLPSEIASIIKNKFSEKYSSVYNTKYFQNKIEDYKKSLIYNQQKKDYYNRVNSFKQGLINLLEKNNLKIKVFSNFGENCYADLYLQDANNESFLNILSEIDDDEFLEINTVPVED